MESTVSVSKGVFVFPNGINTQKPIKKKKGTSLFAKMFHQDPWYSTFSTNWTYIEEQLKELHQRTYDKLLVDIVNYIRALYVDVQEHLENIVPSATLLTGVNQPDHVSQFTTLINKLREEVSPHVAMVHSQDAGTVKQFVENTVWQLIYGHEATDVAEDGDVDMSPTKSKSKLKRYQCTMTVLKKWYHNKYSNDLNNSFSPHKKKKHEHRKKVLVIILPDFESFKYNVLQDFVLILSSYTSSLPLVLVFGVATSVSALHKSFPYQVSSKLEMRVFHSHSAPVYMNKVLEEIFLTETCPFQLSSKAFAFLTDMFLFYDLSVTGFIQGVKYCMMEHFYGDNIKSLCCGQMDVEEAVNSLRADELEELRRLLSFRPYLERQDCSARVALFEDDTFFRKAVCDNVKEFHDYLKCYYTALRVLCAFVKDLPRNTLGKTPREIYCTTESITQTQAFKESMQLLNLQSQSTLLESIQSAIQVLDTSLKNVSPLKTLPARSPHKLNLVIDDKLQGLGYLKTVKVHLMTFSRCIEKANQDNTLHIENVAEDDNDGTLNRHKLKEKLLKATRVERVQSELEMVRSRLVCYLEEMFSKCLQPPHTRPFHEIFVFDDIVSVKKQIVGSPRGALHTALTNPAAYLQCSCCPLASADSIVSSLPDVSIAYKLHRECGRHINLYDWLQAFAALLEPGHVEEDERRVVAPQIQARFNRAVAELQFLGFIKASKRKTDHVMRLTW